MWSEVVDALLTIGIAVLWYQIGYIRGSRK